MHFAELHQPDAGLVGALVVDHQAGLAGGQLERVHCAAFGFGPVQRRLVGREEVGISERHDVLVWLVQHHFHEPHSVPHLHYTRLISLPSVCTQKSTLSGVFHVMATPDRGGKRLQIVSGSGFGNPGIKPNWLRATNHFVDEIDIVYVRHCIGTWTRRCKGTQGREEVGMWRRLGGG